MYSKYDSQRNKDGNYERYFVGYEYINNLSIEFDNDNKMLGKVLYGLSKCSSKPEFSVKYRMKDYSEMKQLLLERSVANAEKKALIISNAAGVTLGEIISIDYSWSDINIYHEENKCQIIKIGKIISTDLEKLCGNKMWVFTCSAVIGDVEKVFELKYDLEKYSWMLYKI